MKQSTYDIIAKCITLGAPALYNEVMSELNEVIRQAADKEVIKEPKTAKKEGK